MRNVIIKALELAKAIASWTPNTVDDRIISALDEILGSDKMLNFIVDLIERWLRGPEPVMMLDSKNVDLNQPEMEEIENAGIDIATILMIARIIMEIIEKWRNR